MGAVIWWKVYFRGYFVMIENNKFVYRAPLGATYCFRIKYHIIIYSKDLIL